MPSNAEMPQGLTKVLQRRVADVLDVVAHRGGHVRDIARLVVERPRVGLRGEDRHARLALEEERPLVLRRVPVHLADRARLGGDLGDGDSLGDVEDLEGRASVRVDGARVITRVGEASVEERTVESTILTEPPLSFVGSISESAKLKGRGTVPCGLSGAVSVSLGT